MRNTALKDAVCRLLPRVQSPAQYLGGELNSVVKDHRQVRGKLCLAFPDAYTLGMSHHGLKRGLASLCLGGGNAVAMILERV